MKDLDLPKCPICGRQSMGEDPVKDALTNPDADKRNARDYCWRARKKFYRPHDAIEECLTVANEKATAQLNRLRDHMGWSREWWDGDLADELLYEIKLIDRDRKEASAAHMKALDHGEYDCHHARAYAELKPRYETYQKAIGTALEGIRKRRDNGEPARSDREEVERLVMAVYQIPRVVQDEVCAAIVNVRDHDQAVRYAKTLQAVISERLHRIRDL